MSEKRKGKKYEEALDSILYVAKKFPETWGVVILRQSYGTVFFETSSPNYIPFCRLHYHMFSVQCFSQLETLELICKDHPEYIVFQDKFCGDYYIFNPKLLSKSIYVEKIRQSNDYLEISLYKSVDNKKSYFCSFRIKEIDKFTLFLNWYKENKSQEEYESLLNIYEELRIPILKNLIEEKDKYKTKINSSNRTIEKQNSEKSKYLEAFKEVYSYLNNNRCNFDIEKHLINITTNEETQKELLNYVLLLKTKEE